MRITRCNAQPTSWCEKRLRHRPPSESLGQTSNDAPAPGGSKRWSTESGASALARSRLLAYGFTEALLIANRESAPPSTSKGGVMSRAEETGEPREHSQESDQAPVASVQPLGVPSEGPVGLADTPAQTLLRARVREACAPFGNAYWRELDRQRAYPEEFVRAFTENRLLAALIPDEYGGLGLPLSDAAIVTEEINHAGGN